MVFKCYVAQVSKRISAWECTLTPEFWNEVSPQELINHIKSKRKDHEKLLVSGGAKD